jgi:hypothetical protein
VEHAAFERLFTVEEADALLPRLRGLLADISAHLSALREKAPHLEPILAAAGVNGGGRVGSEYGVEAYRLYVAIGRVRELGVLIKDLETGLLDFPHERDGHVVFLCWLPDEERITHWHELEAGFAGRQPL